jgi:hypothetical protein
MNIPQHAPLHPHQIRTRRPIRLRLVNKRKIVKDIHPAHLLINNIPPIACMKRPRELRHRASIRRPAFRSCV